MFSQSVSSGRPNSNSQRSLTGRQALFAAIAAAILVLSAPLAAAQAAKTGSTPPPEPSRFDLYGGYAYFHPFSGEIGNVNYQPINPGAVVSAAGYFNKYLGVQAEGSFFPSGPNDCVFTAQAGPIVRYQKNRWVPFAHALVGGAKVGGPSSSLAPGAGESPAASASTTSFPHSTTSSPSAPFRQTLITPTSTTARPALVPSPAALVTSTPTASPLASSSASAR